ncbi:MAG: NAD-glutamate dehydrogenase, partial [Gemmatimonadetes bacterium]|nr:NAD-glutamate dehydrogenase [Gemmatimonadota bacterium]
IRSRLEEVRLATDDYERMSAKLEEIGGWLGEAAPRMPDRRDEIAEVLEFLRWLRERGFVFLGYRGYNIVRLADGRQAIALERGSGLGILRREERSTHWEPTALDVLPPDLRALTVGGPLLLVSKSNAESRVRRRARMDYIGIKKLDEGVIGEHRFLGLFTRKAYAEPAAQIPVLRRKLEQILAAERVPKGSHDYEAIVALFNSMPKEQVFLGTVEDLRDEIAAIMEAEGTGAVRLRVRGDALGRGVNALVLLPTRNFSDEVHRRVCEELVTAFGGLLLGDHVALSDGEESRLHFYIAAPADRIQRVDLAELERRVARIVVSWRDRLCEILEERFPPEEAHRLIDTFAGAFPAEYAATMDPEAAVSDIARLEALESTGRIQVALESYTGDIDASVLRIFAPHGQLILADLMPTLENLGLRVLEADAIDVAHGTPRAATIHTFLVQGPERRALDIERLEPLVSPALLAVRGGLALDYPLNRLVVSALLEWREVAVLLAYSGYAFQIQAVPSRKAIVDALTNHPESARLLFDAFRTKFDPARRGDRSRDLARLYAQFLESLDSVESIADDRTLRRLHNLVQATVRTNVFQSRARSRPLPVIALKFDCAAVETMPKPRPLYDVYVYSPRAESVHLRMGKVARGGIRWSDRFDDFRTEALGLVKTQNVKNAVIVPAGAKGAFALRNPPADRAALSRMGTEAYRDFIRGLLDITDNIVEGRVVHPADTVVYDGEDPYLVVAADKGTATFSDIANAVAAEYGTWPGDAFASGGSHGYDHKKLAITARGVWEAVRRHLREMGKNVERDPITVVGIGDMSGDVFGNGLLLSRTLKLVAAFDHRHIFLDPDPDPETSYGERKRLFEKPGSSWEDYKRELLSRGGGVYKRGAKKIKLSPEVRALLGIEESVVNGETLIKAVLRAPVDLVWNGGIGSYAKASRETHAEVGDPTNDAVRVDAAEVRARVIGEGGNLGFTQLARVEYSLTAGGRCNADFIDNSAGVDLSDHEVNLKILLQPLLEAGTIARTERDRLLEEAADDIVREVLADNHSQSRALSLELRRAQRRLPDFRDLILHLQRRRGLDRALEHLPDSEELRERQQAGQSLTRAELAVLFAYAKLDLKQEILGSTLPEDPALVSLLRDYFPEVVLGRVGPQSVEQHPLRRQIIATVLTNRVLDLMGSTFVFRVARDTGAPPSAIVRGWFAAAEIAGVPQLLARIRELEPELDPALESRSFLALEEALERATRWAAESLSDAALVRTIVESYRAPVTRLRECLQDTLAPSQRRILEAALQGEGGPDRALARSLAALRYVDELLEITLIARDLGLDPEAVARAYYRVAEDVDFPWLNLQLERLPDEDAWARRALQTLTRDLRQARRRLVTQALEQVREGATVEESLARFRDERRDALAPLQNLIAEVRQADRVSLAALTVVVREITARAGATP